MLLHSYVSFAQAMWLARNTEKRSVKVPMTDERYWRVPEVASRLRVAPETVRRWLRAGKLRGMLISQQGGYRVPDSEVRRFIAEHLGNSESEPTGVAV
jgi:excisionase family DNA binding protein